jgi:hypothetical protein
MSRAEMLAKFFINDAAAGQWRLKGHAKKDFYKWMASWSVFIRKPSDIGFNDDGYKLPKLNICPIYIDTDYIPEDELFPVSSVSGITGRIKERKNTVMTRLSIAPI